MNLLSRFIRIIQLFSLFYVILAVLYASHFLIVSPLCAGLSFLLNRSLSPWYIWPPSSIEATLSLDPMPSWSGDVEWQSSDISPAYNLGHKHHVVTDGDLFLSKALSSSMRPSRTIPYFYRANGTFDPDDITITTLITSNRFQVFRRLVERYQGLCCLKVYRTVSLIL
jgi:hypothetical protein